MKRQILLFFLITTVIASNMSKTFAQETKKEEKPQKKEAKLTKHRIEKAWTIEAGGGVSTFFKENMGSNIDYKSIAPIGHFAVNRAINDIFILGLEGNYGMILGQEVQPTVIDGRFNMLINFSNWANKDVVDSRFTFYGKIGGGINYLQNQTLPALEKNWAIAGGAGIIVDYNMSKHFALRLHADGNIMKRQYYTGGSDKDYNFNRMPIYLNAGLSLAYKFNFAKDKEQKMKKLIRSQNKEFFRKDVHEFDIKTKESIGQGEECLVEVNVIKGDFKADAKLEIELLPGIMGYNEKTGKYDLETIKIVDDNMTAKDTIHYLFKLKATQKFDRGLYVMGTYSYINKHKKRQKVKIESAVYKSSKWEFRVQLAAFSQIPFTNETAHKYFRIDAEIIDEDTNGVTKFLIGRFKSYAKAKSYCKKIQEDTTIQDAFVVGYKDGIRIKSLKGHHFGSYK
ncbi:SPOR domain-containing protein [Halosquirtibacter laminarini]|uniref:SPOR domain-containing protein n=1 Tax=Halosquirtibacter laminarini TaxID=3374600 RepID=A0AC61NCM0_9BACT|nr:SPOR domain-containing protein [Prolixibacteraceae bacterium]